MSVNKKGFFFRAQCGVFTLLVLSNPEDIEFIMPFKKKKKKITHLKIWNLQIIFLLDKLLKQAALKSFCHISLLLILQNCDGKSWNLQTLANAKNTVFSRDTPIDRLLTGIGHFQLNRPWLLTDADTSAQTVTNVSATDTKTCGQPGRSSSWAKKTQHLPAMFSTPTLLLPRYINGRHSKLYLATHFSTLQREGDFIWDYIHATVSTPFGADVIWCHVCFYRGRH